MRCAACLPVLCFALWTGCVVEPLPRYRVRDVRPGGLKSEEILRMSQAGVSDAIIIERINADGIVAQPTSEELVALKKEGLSDQVLWAMLAARIEAAEKVVEYVYYPYSYSYPYAYGYPYYYGSWGYYPYGYAWPYAGWHHGYYSHYGGPYPASSYSVGHYRH